MLKKQKKHNKDLICLVCTSRSPDPEISPNSLPSSQMPPFSERVVTIPIRSDTVRFSTVTRIVRSDTELYDTVLGVLNALQYGTPCNGLCATNEVCNNQSGIKIVEVRVRGKDYWTFEHCLQLCVYRMRTVRFPMRHGTHNLVKFEYVVIVRRERPTDGANTSKDDAR